MSGHRSTAEHATNKDLQRSRGCGSGMGTVTVFQSRSLPPIGAGLSHLACKRRSALSASWREARRCRRGVGLRPAEPPTSAPTYRLSRLCGLICEYMMVSLPFSSLSRSLAHKMRQFSPSSAPPVGLHSARGHSRKKQIALELVAGAKGVVRKKVALCSPDYCRVAAPVSASS